MSSARFPRITLGSQGTSLLEDYQQPDANYSMIKGTFIKLARNVPDRIRAKIELTADTSTAERGHYENSRVVDHSGLALTIANLLFGNQRMELVPKSIGPKAGEETYVLRRLRSVGKGESKFPQFIDASDHRFWHSGFDEFFPGSNILTFKASFNTGKQQLHVTSGEKSYKIPITVESFSMNNTKGEFVPYPITAKDKLGNLVRRVDAKLVYKGAKLEFDDDYDWIRITLSDLDQIDTTTRPLKLGSAWFETYNKDENPHAAPGPTLPHPVRQDVTTTVIKPTEQIIEKMLSFWPKGRASWEAIKTLFVEPIKKTDYGISYVNLDIFLDTFTIINWNQKIYGREKDYEKSSLSGVALPLANLFYPKKQGDIGLEFAMATDANNYIFSPGIKRIGMSGEGMMIGTFTTRKEKQIFNEKIQKFIGGKGFFHVEGYSIGPWSQRIKTSKGFGITGWEDFSFEKLKSMRAYNQEGLHEFGKDIMVPFFLAYPTKQEQLQEIRSSPRVKPATFVFMKYRGPLGIMSEYIIGVGPFAVEEENGEVVLKNIIKHGAQFAGPETGIYIILPIKYPKDRQDVTQYLTELATFPFPLGPFFWLFNGLMNLSPWDDMKRRALERYLLLYKQPELPPPMEPVPLPEPERPPAMLPVPPRELSDPNKEPWIYYKNDFPRMFDPDVYNLAVEAARQYAGYMVNKNAKATSSVWFREFWSAAMAVMLDRNRKTQTVEELCEQVGTYKKASPVLLLFLLRDPYYGPMLHAMGINMPNPSDNYKDWAAKFTAILNRFCTEVLNNTVRLQEWNEKLFNWQQYLKIPRLPYEPAIIPAPYKPPTVIPIPARPGEIVIRRRGLAPGTVFALGGAMYLFLGVLGAADLRRKKRKKRYT